MVPPKSQTHPTELMPANLASHMVASIISINNSLTIRIRTFLTKCFNVLKVIGLVLALFIPVSELLALGWLVVFLVAVEAEDGRT